MVDTALTPVKIASLGIGSAIFFLAMVYVGSLTEDWIDSASDFLVSGREINALIIGFGVSAIALAGSMVSAIPEFVVDLGVFPTLMYMLSWVVVISLFGWYLAPIIRRTGVYTTCEWMEQRFDRKTRVVTAIGSVLAGLAVTAAQFVGIGAILAVITDIPFWQATLLITIVTLLYMYLGGLWAVTVTDFLQVALGIVGMIGLAAWLGLTFGGPSWVLANAPANLFDLWGTGVAQPISLQFNSPLTWGLGWIALVLGNQYYWIRIVSARSEHDAKRGPVLGGAIALLLVILLLVPGIYALVGLGAPDAAGYDIRGIVGVFILDLPVGLDALLLVTLLAAVMSTASTTIIGTTTILIRDAWEPIMGTAAASEEVVGPSRWFTVILSLLAWALAASWGASAALMLALGWAFVAPLAAVIVLGLLWPRTTGTGAFTGVIAGIVSVLVWEPTGMTEFAHATWPGVFVPALVAVVVSLVTNPPYYGEASWERSPSSSDGLVSSAGTETPPSGTVETTSTGRHELFRELAKPWTPVTVWNVVVERRGLERGGLVHLLTEGEEK